MLIAEKLTPEAVTGLLQELVQEEALLTRYGSDL